MRALGTLMVAGIIILGASGCAQQQEPANESIVGQWIQKTDTTTMLDFAADKSFTGNDGCNSLLGTWNKSDHVITLENTAMTLMACQGVDTWLSMAHTVEMTGDTLKINNAQGQEIGVLNRGEGAK
ncbi:META domain-containing protein [Arthrobacter sp. MYb227]|uniref:META domain-containing protein n=1 Tax=Arthrobacter sp. MYb227 TaxID=1848601 RepID=UPI0011B04D97|nr:META domain-containing protein [Arthrobacter sp. MYb227]